MPATRPRMRLLLPLLLLHFAALPAMAEEPPTTVQPEKPRQLVTNIPPPTLVYQPPNRGAPAHRRGGGTRSISQLKVLAPNHTAITTRQQPRLYWYISSGLRNNIHFRLSIAGVTPALLEVVQPAQPNGGIQYLDLATHNVRLKPGELYEWGVMLEPEPHQHWPTLISLGHILAEDSDQALQAATAKQRPYVAARRGYWYDALDSISRLIDADSNSAYWRQQRAALLKQGELPAAAAYEEEKAKSLIRP